MIPWISSVRTKNNQKEIPVAIIRVKPPKSRPMSEVKRKPRDRWVDDIPKWRTAPHKRHPSVTYFMEIRPDGPVKIGRTVCLGERYVSGRAFNDQLRIVATFDNKGETAEIYFHRKFAEHRLEGELFDGDVIREWLRQAESTNTCLHSSHFDGTYPQGKD